MQKGRSRKNLNRNITEKGGKGGQCHSGVIRNRKKKKVANGGRPPSCPEGARCQESQKTGQKRGVSGPLASKIPFENTD